MKELKTNVNKEIIAQVPKPQKVLVIGATGGSGKATVKQLLAQGHKVTAFSRNAQALNNLQGQLKTVNGDVMHLSSLEKAVIGQDVVIVTLGITENPIRVRLLGTENTAYNVRSQGTQNIVTAMKKHGVERLVVQSSYGVGETRGLLGFFDQLFFSLILKPQIDDTELQESIVKSSGLNWTVAQPVHLTSEVSEATPFLSTKGQTRLMKVARKSVAKFLAYSAYEPEFIGKTVAISG